MVKVFSGQGFYLYVAYKQVYLFNYHRLLVLVLKLHFVIIIVLL